MEIVKSKNLQEEKLKNQHFACILTLNMKFQPFIGIVGAGTVDLMHPVPNVK